MPYNDTRPSAALVRRNRCDWLGSVRANRTICPAICRCADILVPDGGGPVGALEYRL